MEDNVMYARAGWLQRPVCGARRPGHREYGNEVATPAEAREILGLKK